ncbi:hypothetical protein [Piscibacillus salipiscarius]|uniref:hypothetical protein n=1 Tax=Piscibacillus salipiscarius TaxID=299480 RepID=UPI0006D0CE0D|nr:hypothetical protein [Piscibacillus salipiscarius]
MIDEWTFNTDLEELIVQDVFSAIKIVVKNSGQPGEIKVTQLMMNIDHPVVDQIPSAKVFFQEETGELIIEENSEYVTVRGAYKEFPMRQMEGTSIMGDDYNLDYDLYQQHIIVEVPKGVKAEVEY